MQPPMMKLQQQQKDNDLQKVYYHFYCVLVLHCISYIRDQEKIEHVQQPNPARQTTPRLRPHSNAPTKQMAARCKHHMNPLTLALMASSMTLNSLM
jgi:hypothetical protein